MLNAYIHIFNKVPPSYVENPPQQEMVMPPPSAPGPVFTVSPPQMAMMAPGQGQPQMYASQMPQSQMAMMASPQPQMYAPQMYAPPPMFYSQPPPQQAPIIVQNTITTQATATVASYSRNNHASFCQVICIIFWCLVFWPIGAILCCMWCR